MIILGIDPGLANTGWGVVETDGQLAAAASATGASPRPPTSRSRSACDAVHTSLLSRHPQARAGRVRHREALLQRERPHRVRDRPGARRRPARHGRGAPAGRGVRPERDQAGGRRVRRRGQGAGAVHGAHDPRRCPTCPKPDHAADALAVAICHANSRGRARLRARRRLDDRLPDEAASSRRTGAYCAPRRGRRRATASRCRRPRSPPCPPRASAVTVLTHLQVREDELSLFGFARRGGPRAVRAAHHASPASGRRWRSPCCRR